jgi:hypothetical protein
MVDTSLLEYIKRALQQGQAKSAISQTLINNGWSESAVNEAFSQAMAGEAPKGPDFVAPAITTPQTSASRPVRNYEIYSHFSVLLAFVLFFGLLILSNKIINDIGQHFDSDITGRLIFDSLVILPFLICAFALHYSLVESGEKYRILSTPYYIVSGWLVIRLLFNASSYILSTQVVYGVYIVLVLVVAVLTGVVFFVQKFIKRTN